MLQNKVAQEKNTKIQQKTKLPSNYLTVIEIVFDGAHKYKR
jgi:hypothetical protein